MMISLYGLLVVICILVPPIAEGCKFYPYGEYMRFLRVPENTPVGEVVLQIEVHPRHNLSIQPLDRIEDATYFAFHDINSTSIGVVLYKSLEDLVDRDDPQNVLKFRMACDFNNGKDMVSSYMSVTVYVEDVNDNVPSFIDAPYHITVDELTPVGLTLFRGIQAVDRDKPNTPNSDIYYTILSGNDAGKFSLINSMENSHRAALVLQQPLDYDSGNADFFLTIAASDRGSPSKNTTTTITIQVSDNDDLNPVFTREVYRTQINEFYPYSGRKIHQELRFKPPIKAYDADLAINSPVRYDIIAGNERQLFSIIPKNGSLFLQKEIDLDQEKSLHRNTFVLQIQAMQVDNPLKTASARLEIEILDINDNLPEFEVDLYNISIVENLPNGFSVLQVIATDKDQGDNAEFSYLLDDPSKAFNIDSRTGWLTVRDQTILDRERHSSLSMKVFAREKVSSILNDGHKKSLSSVMIEVTLLDANDNNPTFKPSNLYEFKIPIDAKIGYVVGQVKAIDPDLGRNGLILYSLQRTNTSTTTTGLFSVDPQTGQIRLSARPLRQGRHALFVEASDQPANPSVRRFSLAVVTVEVFKGGKNQLTPDFVGAPYEFWVGSDVPIGTSVGQVRVTEAVDRAKVVYDLLHSYHDGVPFAIEERSGVITVVDSLKNFNRLLYDFEAVVTDEKSLNLVTNVTIHVVDPEVVAAPLFKKKEGAAIEFRVRENQANALVGYLIPPHVAAQQNTSTWWKSLRFHIANQQDIADKFVISSDGTLYTQAGLDREERSIYRLLVLVENGKGFVNGPSIYQVTVIVEDENDNAPIFEHRHYEGHIAENSNDGSEVILNHPVRATDADSGYNAQFKFTIYGEGSDVFTLDQDTGKLFLKMGFGNQLDREQKSLYSLTVVARDKGNLNSEVKLTIHVDDVNDNPPRFLQMVVLHDQDVEIVESNGDHSNKMTLAFEETSDSSIQFGKPNLPLQLPPMIALPENIPVGTLILRLLADDKDQDSTVSYNIVQELFLPHVSVPLTITSRQKHFMIHSSTGEMAVAAALPAECEYHLTVSAQDSKGLSDNATVRVYVKDVNDHAPIFLESNYEFTLLEGSYANHQIGRVEASDADYNENANISYSISHHGNAADLPFYVSPMDGTIFVTATIDREVQEIYEFLIVATDRGKVPLSNSVSVKIRILDVNDNAPQFYNYDRLVHIKRNLIENGSQAEDLVLLPVYYTSIEENREIGTVVARLHANDTDFMGNGNGLVFYDIHRGPNSHIFDIDSKEGTVTIARKLDYEVQVGHNVTIVASDLGSPSLTSTALLVVNVIDVPEEKEEIPGPMFLHRYFEVEVEENCAVPLLLLQINSTDYYKGQHLNFEIVQEKDAEAFAIDKDNGTLYLLVSPDRETKALYEVKIRADRFRRGRGMSTIMYPPPIEQLGQNEVKIVLKVKDVNDNSPRFKLQGRPIVAAIPTTASYGFQIVKLQAADPDEGFNAEIRYQILGRIDDDSHKFRIDPVTGQVRSVATFLKDAGKVYGFDVKATDRRGSDSGRSSIANVFVYVLDDQKQVMMLLGARPTTVERNIDAITGILRNSTGLDVRIRKIEPHYSEDGEISKMTDVYLYGVDPLMNTIIDMDNLQHMLEVNSKDIKRRLDAFRTVEFQYLNEPPPPRPRAQRNTLSPLEIVVVVLGCIVFLGALIGAICAGCVNRGNKTKRRKLEKHFPIPGSGFTLGKAIVKAPPQLFTTGSYLDSLCPGDTTDTYVEMHSAKSTKRRQNRHNPSCHRYHRPRRHHSTAGIHLPHNKTNSELGNLETSLTSLHSKDSGIVESRQNTCPCGYSTSHSSGDSSNGSYEDSLKSLQRRNEANLQHFMQTRRSIHERQRQRQSDEVPTNPAIVRRF